MFLRCCYFIATLFYKSISSFHAVFRYRFSTWYAKVIGAK